MEVLEEVGGRRGGFGGRRAFEGEFGVRSNPFAGILGLKRIRIMAFGMGMGMDYWHETLAHDRHMNFLCGYNKCWFET